MKSILFLIIIATSSLSAQDVPVIKFGELQKILENKDKEILVINFWATWCAPCVAELPSLEKLYLERRQDLSMYLINLDYVDKVSRVQSFVKRKNITAPVLLLDEIDYNSWIDKVDNTWSGAIPATLFINTKTGQRKFVGKELSEEQLQNTISEIQNKK